MTPAQVVILDQERTRVQRQADRASSDGPVERGSFRDLAELGGFG